MPARSEKEAGDGRWRQILLTTARAAVACFAAGAAAGSAAAATVELPQGPGSASAAPAFAAPRPLQDVRGRPALGHAGARRAFASNSAAVERAGGAASTATAAAAVGFVIAAAARRSPQQRRRRFGARPAASLGTGGALSIEDNRKFLTARTVTFVLMIVGYATYYCTRLSFSFVGPAMRQSLGLSMLQLGAVSSIFPLAYMNSKFIAGVLSDLLGSPSMIFSLGMMLTGLCNIGLSFGSSVPWFTFFWVANGLFQGCGGSPCGKLLVNWFPTVTRGKWWSGWNASSNIGGFLIPLIAGRVAATFGWRWGMRVPGLMAIAIGALCLPLMRDSPEKMGLPTAEAHHALLARGGEPEPEEDAEGGEEAKPKAPAEESGEKQSTMQVLFGNKFLWCMAAMHFFVYLMRQGVMNWAHFYLMDQFGVPSLEATARVSGFEFGGLIGCVTSGQLSDFLIKRNPKAGAAGMRARVMFLYALISPLAILGLWKLPPIASLQWAAMAVFGFSLYGPQTLITMTGVETVPPSFAASTSGILAYPAQLGSMFAGLPFALVVKRYGWSGYFPSLVILSLLSALSVLPGWNAQSHSQKAEAKALAASST